MSLDLFFSSLFFFKLKRNGLAVPLKWGVVCVNALESVGLLKLLLGYLLKIKAPV